MFETIVVSDMIYLLTLVVTRKTIKISVVFQAHARQMGYK